MNEVLDSDGTIRARSASNSCTRPTNSNARWCILDHANVKFRDLTSRLSGRADDPIIPSGGKLRQRDAVSSVVTQVLTNPPAMLAPLLHFRVIQLLCGTDRILERQVGETGKFVGNVISLRESGVFPLCSTSL